MDKIKIERVLISVYNKDGVLTLAKFLSSKKLEIISTSKTAKMLSDEGIPVTKIEDVTKFPEIMGGRVKTLHPNIFAGILARRDLKEDIKSLNDLNVKPIDMVVVNLYPFVETISKPNVTLDEAIENIDIGGPSMIRASAKNHKYVTVVTDPNDYSAIIEELKENDCQLSMTTRFKLAVKAFKTTFEYDGYISNYLSKTSEERENQESELPQHISLNFTKLSSLRYGENPHQRAALYSVGGFDLARSLAVAKPIQGKEISYNNLVDAQGALNIVRDIEGKNVVAVIKHTNPCGVGRSESSLLEAYKLAFECDPISAFGGIVCLNNTVDGEVANEINKLFTEVVIAPKFSEDALKIFSKKKNLRLIELDIKKSFKPYDLKLIDGGALLQDIDSVIDDVEQAKAVTERKPTDMEMKSLKFAMNICKNVKSNAIVIANAKQSVGIGAGQTSRVDSAKIAIMKAQTSVKGCVLASDAFFPFRDSIDLIAKEGITAVIEPGGSIKDEEVIAACNEHKIAMLFTGKRHFKH